jgi:hypothetical protein
MDSALKLLATIEFGALSSKIVSDPSGRRCIAIMVGEREICFTITQALLMREMLDVALRSMANVVQEKEHADHTA